MRGVLVGLAALLVVAGAAPTAAHSGERTHDGDYPLTPEPVAGEPCSGEQPTRGACFPVRTHDDTVRIDVADDRFDDVPARYAFLTSGGSVYEAGTFCTSTTVHFVPSLEEDAPVDRLRVDLLGPDEAPTVCSSPLGLATEGTIEATFTFSP